jgi:hypothetical protein
MLSARDEELLGVSNRSDPMGFLAVWSARARDLVPHLTEQTTQVRGFQVLIEAYRLWSLYQQDHPEHADRLSDFFILVEQVFARLVGCHDDWNLPGARRVRNRAHESPCISISDTDWHLLGGQKANGLWGLYRGASMRAHILSREGDTLSGDTWQAAIAHPGLKSTAQNRLFEMIEVAMEGETVELPTHKNNQLVQDVLETYWNLPLAEYLQKTLIESEPLTRKLADRLIKAEDEYHRQILTSAANDLPEHKSALENVLRCENLISILETVFYWLCASKGVSITKAVEKMPVNLEHLRTAFKAFTDSGNYGDGIARKRQRRIINILDLANAESLARSVLLLHEKVSTKRGRAAWVWEENGTLHSDTEFSHPPAEYFEIGGAWRNDYYLHPLKSISRQLREIRGE